MGTTVGWLPYSPEELDKGGFVDVIAYDEVNGTLMAVCTWGYQVDEDGDMSAMGLVRPAYMVPIMN